MKTSIDNTTGQRSLFLESSIFFSTRLEFFFRLRFQNFNSCFFFFIREHIFCKSRLIFFTVFDVFYKFRLKYYVFNMFLLSVQFCPQRNAIDLSLDYIDGRQGPSALLPRSEYPSSEAHRVTYYLTIQISHYAWGRGAFELNEP